MASLRARCGAFRFQRKMGAWFQCTNCEARYHFDASQAGRAFACRSCGFVFRVPPVPVSHVPDPEAWPAGDGRWFLRFPSGRQFGPAMTPMIEEWVREGRADGESLVCPEGGQDWYLLADAFPDLVSARAEAVPQDPMAPMHSLAERLPAAGLLEFLKDDHASLSEEARLLHEGAMEQLDRELRRVMGAVRLVGTRSLIVGEARYLGGTSSRDAAQMRAEHVLVVEFTAHGSEFYAAIPWGRLGLLPYELFSILPGRLPHPLALRRGTEHSFGEGQWIGINGSEDDVLAVAARRSQEALTSGIVWDWFSAKRDYTMVQVWGVQSVPLGSEKYLHMIQTSPRGQSGNELGLLWYLERQSAFYRFARRLSIPDTHETHVLFGSCAGQILTDVMDHLGTLPIGENLINL
jgi:hypothetical protein